MTTLEEWMYNLGAVIIAVSLFYLSDRWFRRRDRAAVYCAIARVLDRTPVQDARVAQWMALEIAKELKRADWEVWR